MENWNNMSVDPLNNIMMNRNRVNNNFSFNNFNAPHYEYRYNRDYARNGRRYYR